MNQKKAAIILAAGKGKRMLSDLPKVLHKIAGKTMVHHIVSTIMEMGFDKIVVVVGHKGELVIGELKDFDVEFAWQKEQLGTGHAVMMTEELFARFEGTVLVTAGDVPFLSKSSISGLFDLHDKNNASATCLSAIFDDPTGYGRIIRENDSDLMLEIVEEKDATEDIKKITEINSGTFCFESNDLFGSLKKIKNSNAQQEYYLTDMVKLLRQEKKICAVWPVPNPIEVSGINSVEQLEKLESEIIAKNN